MVGVLMLLGCLIVAQVFVFSSSLLVPASVVGMLLMFVWLLVLRRVPDSLRSVSDVLLKVLPLCLVPAGVGLMLYLDLLQAFWLYLLMTLVLSTFITQLVLMYSLKWMNKRRLRSSMGEK